MYNFDISQKGKGAVENKKDIRDYRLEVAMPLGEVVIPAEFSFKDKIGIIKDQGSSQSCVAQTFSYYAEILNTIETGQKTQLSARDIYSLVHLPGGGAYLRDAAKKITNSGVIPEADAPSSEKGNPPDEQFMENRADITPQEQEEGMKYLAKKFVTWDKKNWDTFKKAIYLGKGAASGAMGNNYCWQSQSGILSVPEKSQANWGHAIYFTGVKKINGKEYLEFVNSWSDQWGDKGFGYMPREYVEAGLTFNPVTLIDLPNNTYNQLSSQLFKIKELMATLIKMMAEYVKQKTLGFFKGR